jgi:hypothetical protein
MNGFPWTRTAQGLNCAELGPRDGRLAICCNPSSLVAVARKP